MQPLTPETLRTINAVTSRFFLIQPDGTIKRLNEFNKAIEWCFKQKAAALTHANRKQDVRVYDKAYMTFIAK